MSYRPAAGNSRPAPFPLPMDEITWRRVSEKLALSGQQLRIVELILRGRQDKEIAEELSVSFHTVRTYLRRIFDRTKVTDRIGLVLHIFALAQAEAQTECHHQ